MDDKSKQLFNDYHESILNHAEEYFGVAKESVRRLGSFESAVYEVSIDGSHYILKASAGSHRSPEQIMAELHWVSFLSQKDIPVCRAIESRAGNLVETLKLPEPAASSISLIVFEKAAGKRMGLKDCDRNLQIMWGELLGKMHSLQPSYQPGEIRRPHWHEDDDLKLPDSISASEPQVADRILALQEKLHSLPCTKQNYGLVHSDLHHGNFFIRDGKITIFDTDDCHYDWFINDLAMPLYYTFNSEEIGRKSLDFAASFWKNLVEGYRRQHSLIEQQLLQVSDFLKLREQLLYMIIIKEDILESDSWCRKFMDGRNECIKENVPVINMDFVACLA